MRLVARGVSALRRLVGGLVVVLGIVLLAPAPAHANTYNCSWNTTSGTWETASNWNTCNST